MNQWLEFALKAVEIFSVSYGTIMFSSWLQKRKRSQNLNIDKDFEKRKQILPIMESIRYELDASRVFDMVFTNGDVTMTGHHLKKVSVFQEVTADGVRPLAQDFQLVPSKIFDRTLDALYETNDDYVIFTEFENFDNLSALHAQYDIHTLMKVKIKNQFGKWVGVLNVAFQNERILTEGEIAFVKMQAARLGQIK
jgi:hypothetical protein